MSSTAAGGASGLAAQHHGGGGGWCGSSGVTLELVDAFTAVCLVLYGVILYFNYLYVRWSGCDGCRHRRRAARKRGGGSGLDKEALVAIPVFRFKAAAAHGGNAECAVCLSGMQDGNAMHELLGCGHAFHFGCVDAWLRAHGTCPVCLVH
uniref:RING-type domain-containing protein n=1 Tax=Oryza meridionalis TaxID=40149 RepID=A0A0E0E1E1_9ORYZ